MLKKLCVLVACFIAAAAMAAVEVNKATEADLDGLPGIGPATTQLILNERKKSEFKDWPDFMRRVKGIGETRASKLSAAGLTVGGAGYKDKPSAKSASKQAADKPAAEKAPVLTPAAVVPADKKKQDLQPANMK
jgi:competence protein ComEA